MNPTFNSENERHWLIEIHKRRSDRAIQISTLILGNLNLTVILIFFIESI